MIHTVFVQANAIEKVDSIYIKDKANDRAELDAAGYVNARYTTCDSSVRSEKAYPIVADGRRIAASEC